MTTILIVDDNKDIRELIGLVAEMCFVRYDFAENGSIAIEKFRKRSEKHDPYAVVLLDVSMPVMSGIEASVVMKKIDSTIPIVFVSGNSRGVKTKMSYRVSEIEYIEKPFDISLLTQIILSHTSLEYNNTNGVMYKEAKNLHPLLN